MEKISSAENNDSNVCVGADDVFVKDTDSNTSDTKTAIEFVEMLEAEYGNNKYDFIFEIITYKENDGLSKSIFEKYLDSDNMKIKHGT